jgi:MFS family permease
MPAGYWIIWTTVALDLVGFGIIVPILGHYAEEFGANGFQVGLMFATFSVAQMIFAPILGRSGQRGDGRSRRAVGSFPWPCD